MNSSGIKRGLATTAVSALAIAGLPLFASTASAATGDEIVVAYQGPARNGATGAGNGALLVLETKGITLAEAQASLKVVGTNLTSGANTPTQTIGAPQVVALNTDTANQTDAEQEFGDNDGYDELIVQIPVSTTTTGDTANFAVYLDDDANGNNAGTVQASEPRAQVSVKTAGAPTSVEIAPNSQVAPQGQLSGNYTLTVKDSAGRVTQLVAGESIGLAATGNTNIVETGTTADNTTAVTDNDTVSPAEATRGTATFKASNANTGGYTITATGNGGNGGVPTSATAQATLNVVGSANINASELDIVTGADSWEGFGADANDTFASGAQVRVDQTSVTLNFKAPNDANTTVALAVTGNGLTFDGGKSSKTVAVNLDSNGVGTVTLTPDAGSIQVGDSIGIQGSGITNGNNPVLINFVRAAASSIRSAAQTYVSKIGGSVDVTVTVLDQFGKPVTSGLVNVQRIGGVNADASPSAKKPVGADGTVTFTLTDSKATANSTAPDTVRVRYYQDEFAAAPTNIPANNANNYNDVATIRYTVDGNGNPISFTADNVSVDGNGYTADQVTLNPLTEDGNASTQGALGTPDEYVVIGIVGGTPGAAVTVSADNGALILRNPTAASDDVASGKSSVTGVAGDTYWLIATKTGAINVTVTSAGQTKTAAVTAVAVPTANGRQAATARNVSVEGPTAAVSGDLVEFVATITDGYGNPVAGVGNVNVRVTGPARLQDADALSGANGQLGISVRLDDDASSPVTVTVEGVGSAFNFDQFGDAANTIGATTGNAPGIPASDASDSATIDDVTNLKVLEQAVADAEQALADAQDALAAAQGDLDVAQTELAVAQANVDTLKAKKAELRKKLNKAKENGNKQKAKTTRKKLRAVKRDLADAKDAATIAMAKVDAAQVVVDNATQDVADAQADLDEAQANLEEAQN